MSQKYSDARYPEKINDLIDNEGGLSEEGKSTINESVKEAIEGGDIPVPAGGTKLYQHYITIEGGGTPDTHLTVISPSATPATSWLFLRDEVVIYVKPTVSTFTLQDGTTKMMTGFPFACNTGNLYAVGSANGQEELVKIPNFSTMKFKSDTVTEL